MPKLADRIAEIIAAKKQTKEAEINLKAAKENERRIRIRPQETIRADAVIAAIPDIVEQAVWNDEHFVVIMTDIEDCDVAVVYDEHDEEKRHPRLVPAGEAVVAVRDWCKSQGFNRFYIRANSYHDRHSPVLFQDQLKSADGRYELILQLGLF